MQAFIDSWCINDMECGNRQSESCGLDATANHDLRLICKTLVRFVFRRKFGRKDLLEDGLLRIVVLKVLSAEGSGYQFPLVLCLGLVTV